MKVTLTHSDVRSLLARCITSQTEFDLEIVPQSLPFTSEVLSVDPRIIHVISLIGQAKMGSGPFYVHSAIGWSFNKIGAIKALRDALSFENEHGVRQNHVGLAEAKHFVEMVYDKA